MSEWINVKSKLPKSGTVIWIFGRYLDGWDMETFIGRFNHIEKEFYLEDGNKLNNVTHWKYVCFPEEPSE